MPVYFKRCGNIDELLDLKVDAVAVPRMGKGDLPKFTQYIYSKAGTEKINKLYKENEGNDYWLLKHFPDIPADEYSEQCGLIFDSDPIITVTGGCGLDLKYIFHICIGLFKSQNAVTYSDNPELYEALSSDNWDEDDYIIDGSDDLCDPDNEDCFILRRCYEVALSCAQKHGVRSIAFPMLGTENNSVFSYSAAYHIAHTAPQAWLEEHTSYEQMSVHDESIGGYSGKYRLKDEMEIWIIDLPYDFKWSFNPVPNATDEEELDAFRKKFRIFERNLKEKIDCSGKPPEQFARDFIWDHLKDVNISRLNKTIMYDATKFKNGQLSKPALHRVIAIAVGLGLDDFDRFTFIRCAGYSNYPSTKFELDVENAVAAGARDFDALTEALYDKGYVNDPLTSNVRGSKSGKNTDK